MKFSCTSHLKGNWRRLGWNWLGSTGEWPGIRKKDELMMSYACAAFRAIHWNNMIACGGADASEQDFSTS